ncbi:MAG TPA: winged helix-turn-helix domain-containing protein [Bryobacterales bacterium]|nr:winged helix-turn-helix domain-containing protein [Bryobacterales bacterium]
MLAKHDGFVNMTTYQDPHLCIHFHRQTVLLDGAPLTLTRKEYELLALLSQNAGEIVPRPELLMRIWGYGEGIRTRTLDVHIRRLRRKLAPFTEQYIETIFGVGYRFQPYRVRGSYQVQPALAMPAIA